MKNLFFQTLLIAATSFTVSFNSVFAQQKLIEANGLGTGSLSATELVRYNKLANSPMYTSHHLVSFGSLAATQNEGEIKVKIPNHHCDEVVFKGKDIYYTTESKYNWYGNVVSKDTCGCSDGSITLISDENGKIGHISIDEDAYEITEIGNSKYVMSKIDDTKFTEDECGVNDSTPVYISRENGGNISKRDGSNCDVRCLVLFTPNALDEEPGNITSRLSLGIYQTNIALQNSDVDECDLRIILAGSQEFDFEETSDILGDVDDFANNPDVQDLRDEFEADIVVLLTDGDYGDIFGVVAAIGPIDESAYAVVEVGAATTGRYTFAHEIAHLFGAGHDSDPRPGIPHGHSFVKCLKRKRTIMHTLPSGKSRIQHFSNPDVSYAGKPTGKNDERDNALQLRTEACAVADFRETNNPFAFWVTGAANQNEADWFYGCPCLTKLLQAHTSGGGTGSSTFQWAKSSDGINWTNISTSQYASFAMPCEEGEYIYIRLIATSPDGQTGTLIKTVIAKSPLPSGQSCPQPIIVVPGGIVSDAIVLENAFPNPTKGTWKVEFESTIDGHAVLTLSGFNGGAGERVFSGYLPKGRQSFLLSNESLPKGVYYLRIEVDNGGSETIKLVKI